MLREKFGGKGGAEFIIEWIRLSKLFLESILPANSKVYSQFQIPYPKYSLTSLMNELH